MVRNFIITLAFFALVGCQTSGLPPVGEGIETGKQVHPPAGWIDLQNRKKQRDSRCFDKEGIDARIF